MYRIEFEVTKETYERLQLLTDVVNYRRKRNGNELSIDNIAKGALSYYLNRFYANRINEQEVEKLIPLGSFGELSNTIWDYIDELKLQPSDIATELQITRGQMSKILHNKQQPSLELFIRIWVALGCPPLHKLLKREINNSHTCQEESHIP